MRNIKKDIELKAVRTFYKYEGRNFKVLDLDLKPEEPADILNKITGEKFQVTQVHGKETGLILKLKEVFGLLPTTAEEIFKVYVKQPIELKTTLYRGGEVVRDIMLLIYDASLPEPIDLKKKIESELWPNEEFLRNSGFKEIYLTLLFSDSSENIKLYPVQNL